MTATDAEEVASDAILKICKTWNETSLASIVFDDFLVLVKKVDKDLLKLAEEIPKLSKLSYEGVAPEMLKMIDIFVSLLAQGCDQVGKKIVANINPVVEACCRQDVR